MGKLFAIDETPDQTRVNPPEELKLSSLNSVAGAYGFKSPEYKAVNAIPFRKPKL